MAHMIHELCAFSEFLKPVLVTFPDDLIPARPHTRDAESVLHMGQISAKLEFWACPKLAPYYKNDAPTLSA